MPFVYECPTRWGDMDAQGHLNNCAYVDYLQEARVAFLHSGPHGYLLGMSDDPEHRGFAIVVTQHQLEFLKPVSHGEPLRIEVRVESVGAARFVLAYDLYAGDDLAGRARTVLCPFDLEANRIRRLTDAERAWHRAQLEPCEPLRHMDKIRIGDRPASEYAAQVRWSDLDSYRHVNNVRFYDYVQEARIGVLTAGMDEGSTGSAGLGDVLWLVLRQDVDYLDQMTFSLEPYRVRCVVQKLGTSSMTIAAEIDDPRTGKLFATARTVAVAADPETGRPIEISRPIRDALAPWTL